MKVAKVLSEELDASIMDPEEIDPKAISDYDLIGFGSGIYNQKHKKGLFNLIEKLQPQNGRRAFVFSTNTYGLTMLHKPLNNALAGKGFEIVDEFSCRGFIDHSFIKLFFGGISKGRPNNDDLESARMFAKRLISK